MTTSQNKGYIQQKKELAEDLTRLANKVNTEDMSDSEVDIEFVTILDKYSKAITYPYFDEWFELFESQLEG